tara:strand:+ start:122 stop:751 length:630 start_codon:yes stop_codon:yes gene_type:complete
VLSLSDLRIPDSADVFLAVDTGTFMSGLAVAITRDYHAFVVAEFPNYRYISDQIELNDTTTPEWAQDVVATVNALGGKPSAWADANTQFRGELRKHGLRLLSNTVGPDARVQVAREYFRHQRVHLAPWLSILPYELEHAKWPPKQSSAGRFSRIQKSDHTLVCLEHILSRRPRASIAGTKKKKTFLEQYLKQHRPIGRRVRGDPHLGVE